MRSNLVSKAALVLAVTSLTVVPALAQKADQLTYINGLDPARAEGALKAHGFEYADSNTNDMGYTYSYWWNAQNKNCVQVEAYNGKVGTVTDATDKECKHGGISTGAAVGIAAGAAILGAILLSKGKKDQPASNVAQPASFADLKGARAAGGMTTLEQRGFTQVDNFTSGTTRYSIQWRPQSRQCVQVTMANGRFTDLRDIGRHPKCNGTGYSNGNGYAAPAAFADLKGARAAGGMTTLEQRGFTQVDNFTSGTTRYSIQWRPQSRQCVQVTIANGHFDDLRDIGSHPKCR